MDIDIDFADRTAALALFKHVTASRKENDALTRHNTGVYFHAVPVVAEQNIAAIPYKQAEQQGHFKVDFLNVGVYNGIRNEAHLIELMDRTPLWDLLEDNSFTDLLFHVNGHGDVLKKMKPTSIEQLAAVLAMIRPAKRYLVGQDWATVDKEIWTKPDSNEYFFKKSHALAYAAAVAVQMNLICEQVSYEFS